MGLHNHFSFGGVPDLYHFLQSTLYRLCHSFCVNGDRVLKSLVVDHGGMSNTLGSLIKTFLSG